jgi:glycosyltransferase involved in cell wall biosynthesis
VVLPVRDAEKTLGDAIVSILGQSLREFELLVIDDKSNDASAQIARQFAMDDPRVRVLGSREGGLVHALQTGCLAARGEFVARMDADDISHPDRLARQIERMRADLSVGLCGARVEDFGTAAAAGPSVPGEGRRRYSSWLNSLATHDDITRNLFVECPVAHPAFFLRRSALEEVGGYRDAGWAEDYDLVFRLWQAGWRFAMTPGEPLVKWRDSAGRLSRTDPRYSPARFRDCKFHYLVNGPMLPAGRRLLQWGAGEEGKEWLKLWKGSSRKPEFVVDVDPRKIGQRIHGVEVVRPEGVGEPGGALLMVAVSAPGAREEIRAWLAPRRWVEGTDFLFVA